MRQRDRETERQRDRKTEIQRETQRDTERQGEKERDREITRVDDDLEWMKESIFFGFCRIES